MKWTVNDIDMYLKSKEYVDTTVVPLIPINWEKDVKSTVLMGEFINLMTYELERQFKGRIVLFPPFTYLKSEKIEEKLERLQSWEQEMKNGEAKNIFYITSDVDWKQVEKSMNESLIWLPALPLEHVEEKYKDKMLRDQMDQLIPLFVNRWKNQ